MKTYTQYSIRFLIIKILFDGNSKFFFLNYGFIKQCNDLTRDGTSMCKFMILLVAKAALLYQL